MSNKPDEIVQVPVPASISGAGETETVEPTAAEVPGDQTVVAETIPSDDLNDAVGEGAAAEGDVANEEPVAESVGASVSPEDSASTTPISGPDDENLSFLVEEATETTETPEVDESEDIVTGDDTQEAADVEEKSPEALTADIMRDPAIQNIATSVKGEMALVNGSLVKVCFFLEPTKEKLSNKSFRHFAIHILDMDPKYANDLRGVGLRFKPYWDRKMLTIDYLGQLGISRLITLSRYAESEWHVDKNRQIIVSVMDKDRVPQAPRAAHSMTVEEIRTNLQNLKSTADQSMSALEMLLDTYEGDRELACDVVAKVGDKKDAVLKQVKEWDGKLKTASENYSVKIKELKKGVNQAETEQREIEKKRGRAKWWVDILTGQNYDWPEGCEDARLAQQKDKAKLDRRRRVLALSDSAASRL